MKLAIAAQAAQQNNEANVKSLLTYTLHPHIQTSKHTGSAINVCMFVRSRSLILNRWMCVRVCTIFLHFSLYFFFSLLIYFLLCWISLVFSIATHFILALSRHHHPIILNFNFLFNTKHNLSTTENMTTCTSYLLMSVLYVNVYMYLFDMATSFPSPSPSPSTLPLLS